MIAVMVAALLAQQVLPAGPLVKSGLADQQEPHTSLAVISTNLFATNPLRSRVDQGVAVEGGGKYERQAVVQLASDFPLLKVKQVVLSLQGGVSTRFRMQAQDKDELSNDFIIALPFQYVNGPYAARVRLIHRSSHLGDEFVLNNQIRRVEFTHEEADALLARSFGNWRAYAAGSKTLRSYFVHDKYAVQAGADGVWRLTKQADAVAGIDWQKHSITEGLARFQAIAGLQVRGPAGSMILQGEYSSGGSPLGEFFPDRERYWGVELRLSRSQSTGNSGGSAGIR